MDGVKVNGIVDLSTSPQKLMASCSDFLNERTLMEELVLERGHEFEKTPKCHPEVAGDGIEYDWGKSKHDFRELNDGVPANLRRNIVSSFDGLTRQRRFLFSRKEGAFVQTRVPRTCEWRGRARCQRRRAFCRDRAARAPVQNAPLRARVQPGFHFGELSARTHARARHTPNSIFSAGPVNGDTI